LRPVAVLQRAGAADLGAGRPDAVAPAGNAERSTGSAGRLLPALSAGDHAGQGGGCAPALCVGDAHAHRHADPCRRLQPRDGRRARRQYQVALYAGVRARCRPRRTCRHDAGAALFRADRHGREHPDPRLRRHHHRRHWFDPRRLRGRDSRRDHRYDRPCISAGSHTPLRELQRRLQRRARTFLDADLHAHGGCAGLPAGRSVPGGSPMSARLSPRNALVAGVIAVLALVPVYAQATANTFMVSLFTRIVILAIAAVSLNLIMGFGGMVSFGHAVYLGIGGYAVGILAKEGINSGLLQWPLAVAASAVFALAVGALSLRTRGVYFIMITLAFAQMVYYVAIGLDRYGGDDGMTIYKRSQFGGLLNLSNRIVFYYLCLALLLATVYLVWRIVNSRFGLVIQGARSNERRMRAIGFPTYRYKLLCFVIAGTLCGLAGALLANHTDFISPALMHWTRSGDLIVM